MPAERGGPGPDDPQGPSGGRTLVKLAVVMCVAILALAALATWAQHNG